MKRIEVYKDMLDKFLSVEEVIPNSFIVLYLDELRNIFSINDKDDIKLGLSNFTLKTISLLPMIRPKYKRETALLTELSEVLKLIAQDMSDEFKLEE